jgi:hypothetical protein
MSITKTENIEREMEPWGKILIPFRTLGLQILSK